MFVPWSQLQPPSSWRSLELISPIAEQPFPRFWSSFDPETFFVWAVDIAPMRRELDEEDYAESKLPVSH